MTVYLLVLCALTTGVAVAWGRWRGRPLAGLRAAFWRALEWAGLTVLVLAADVLAGIALVLALRALTGRFISLYPNADLTLLVLAAVQAFLLQAWWWPREREG